MNHFIFITACVTKFGEARRLFQSLTKSTHIPVYTKTPTHEGKVAIVVRSWLANSGFVFGDLGEHNDLWMILHRLLFSQL